MTTTTSHKKSQLLDIIAARASYPLERLRQEAKDDQQTDEQGGQEYLQDLYRVLQASDAEKQNRFLAHLDLDECRLIKALSLPASAEHITNSSWITLLDHILSEYRHDPTQESIPHDRSFLPGAPLPFEELFLPFISYARQQIHSQVPDYASLLSDLAQVRLEHWLLIRLSSLAGEPLWLEFMPFLTLDDEASVLDEQQPQRVIYEQFLNQYAGEGFLDFFAEYSLLARLLIQVTEQWIEACSEFLARLKADSNLITHTFFAGHPLGRVLDMQAGCSDLHHHGRTVFLLTFADDQKLAYKPRCMAIDEAFYRCTRWLNEKGLSPDLKPVRVLNQNDYGWMEYIKHAPCTTSAEVHSYYQRCGLLLCLFYILGSTDMHFENLVAAGAYPIPIDLETILNPLFRDLSTNSSAEEQKMKPSIMKSGMLMVKMKLDDREMDAAGLGDLQSMPSLIPYLIWRNINTDAMSLSCKHRNINLPIDNKAILDGKIAKSSDYVEDLVVGFRDMYHFLTEHRVEILAEGSMLDFFVGCPIRYVVRSTCLYNKQLFRLQSSDFLQNGTTSWIASQIFKRRLLKEEMDHRCWSISSCELASLEQLDVPWFGSRTDCTDMYSDDGTIIEDVFPASALEQARSCIADLCDEDREQQVQFIYKYMSPHNAEESALA